MFVAGNDRKLLRQKIGNVRRRIGVLTERLVGKLTGNHTRAATRYATEIAAAKSFRPQAYAGRVAVLGCTENASILWRRLPIAEAWAPVIPAHRLEVFEFACDHADVLREPYLSAFVERTVAILGSVRAPGSRPRG